MSVEGGYPDGTSGHSGGASSRDRAEREDKSGVTGWRQKEVLALLQAAGREGMTVHELEIALVLGHGAASGALTRLHRAGYILRLTERRGDQEIYVLPNMTFERQLAPYRPNVGLIDGQRIEQIRREAKREALRDLADHLDSEKLAFISAKWLRARADKL